MPALSIEHTNVRINGHEVTGWSEDSDALMVPDSFEFFTIRRGANGDMVALRNGARGGVVTIKLLPSSPSTVFFLQQAAALLRGAYTVFNGSIADSNLAYNIILRNGVLMTAPLGYTYGQGEVSNREFTFEFERFEMNMDNAQSGPLIRSRQS